MAALSEQQLLTGGDTASVQRAASAEAKSKTQLAEGHLQGRPSLCEDIAPPDGGAENKDTPRVRKLKDDGWE